MVALRKENFVWGQIENLIPLHFKWELLSSRIFPIFQQSFTPTNKNLQKILERFRLSSMDATSVNAGQSETY